MGRRSPPCRPSGQIEHITKWYLQNDPYYEHELANVRLWDEWPDRWKKKECGIDLIAEHRDGSLWAIQAKAYDPDYYITKKDVDTWLTESNRKTEDGLPMFKFKLLVATTDHVSKNAEDAIEGQLIPVGRRLRTALEEAQVIWPATPGDLRAPKPKPKSPLPHQIEAITDVISRFEEHDRGQLISAPGTGKTLSALFIREKRAAERTLVLVPSISLLGQTLDEWMANKTADFAVLPVCSDETVNNDDDIPVSDTSSLGLPVTTDPETIAEFLREVGPRVVFSTYQSSPLVAEAAKLAGVTLDLVIADEAHRTASSVTSMFAAVLDNEKIPAIKRLFVTATPRIYTVKVLDAAKEADFEQASMDDESKYGPVFHELTLGEAIDRKLLTDYQVAIIGVTDDTYRDWAEKGRIIKFLSLDGKEVRDARSVAGEIGLAKAMTNYDLHRVITFHSRVKLAEEFATLFPQVVAWMPEDERPSGQLWTGSVSGEDSADERKRALQLLRNLGEGERGVLSNARCLTEGIDVPTLDGVVFIDPKRSMTDIVQAVGRAIRKAEGKTIGTIIIPVFVDVDEKPELAIDHSAFKTVYDAILAMRAIDKRLAEEIDGIRRQLGPLPGGIKKPPVLPPRIKVDIPSVTDEFSQYFNTRLIELTSVSWEAWFELLKQYVAEKGNAIVPARYKTADGYPLGKWVDHQRRFYAKRNGELGKDRVQRREEVSDTWTWDLHADRWEEGFRHLQEYIDQNGDDPVWSYVTEDGYQLGQWVSNQRALHRKKEGGLEAYRVSRLDELGLSWEPKADAWEEGFAYLQEYVAKKGTALVPHAYVTDDGYGLGHWVAKQRSFRKTDNLDPEREKRLSKVPGWAWSAMEARWEEGFYQLQQYIKRYGKIPGAVDQVDDYKVGSWVVVQRKRYRDKKAPDELAKRLEGLGDVWEWNPKSGPR